MNTAKISLKTAISLIVGATLAIGALSACNTVHGAGKDVKSVGTAVERASD